MNKRQMYYQEHRTEELERVKAKQRAIRKWMQDYKQKAGCQRCGYNKCPQGLDFHHTGEEKKEHTLSRMVSQGRSPVVILAEAAKCVILCRNCHAEVHYGVE